MSPIEIKYIIETGKLKGYIVTAGFLDVYWKTPDLKENTFWLFKFTSIDSKLLSVKQITPNGVYGKWKARCYVPMIEKMMNNLLKPRL